MAGARPVRRPMRTTRAGGQHSRALLMFSRSRPIRRPSHDGSESCRACASPGTTCAAARAWGRCDAVPGAHDTQRTLPRGSPV
jgi:hypothetical protein